MAITDRTTLLPPGQPPEGVEFGPISGSSPEPSPEFSPRAELARALDLADAYCGPLLARLCERGPMGRPPYDPRAMLRVYLAKYLLGVDYNAEMVTMLRMDASLREVCGFEAGRTPDESTVSRFFRKLGSHLDLLDEALCRLVDRWLRR